MVIIKKHTAIKSRDIEWVKQEDEQLERLSVGSGLTLRMTWISFRIMVLVG